MHFEQIREYIRSVFHAKLEGVIRNAVQIRGLTVAYSTADLMSLMTPEMGAHSGVIRWCHYFSLVEEITTG